MKTLALAFALLPIGVAAAAKEARPAIVKSRNTIHYKIRLDVAAAKANRLLKKASAEHPEGGEVVERRQARLDRLKAAVAFYDEVTEAMKHARTKMDQADNLAVLAMRPKLTREQILLLAKEGARTIRVPIGIGLLSRKVRDPWEVAPVHMYLAKRTDLTKETAQAIYSSVLRAAGWRFAIDAVKKQLNERGFAVLDQ